MIAPAVAAPFKHNGNNARCMFVEHCLLSVRSSRLLIIPESNIENNETMKSGKRTNKNERKKKKTDNIQTIEPIINVDVNIAFVAMWRENSSRIKVQ